MFFRNWQKAFHIADGPPGDNMLLQQNLGISMELEGSIPSHKTHFTAADTLSHVQTQLHLKNQLICDRR